MRNLAVPAMIVVFSAVIIVLSLQLDVSPPMIVGDGMQPRVFPIFLMVLNLALVAVLIVQQRVRPPEPVATEPFPTWGSIGLLVVFYALTEWLDMFIGIIVVMFLMCRLWGERRWYVAAALALVTPALIFVLFDQVLQVRFPRGVLIDWYYG